MSLDSENQSSFLSLLLKHLNQTNSDSLETLERENLHFIITDNLIATFEEIKCDIFFAKHHNKFTSHHHHHYPRQSSLTSSDDVIGGEATCNSGSSTYKVNIDHQHHTSETINLPSTPTLSSGSSSYPSSYQDGTSTDWLADQRNGESEICNNSASAAVPNSTNGSNNYETGLSSFSESISNLSEINSRVTLDSKISTEMSFLGLMDDLESADNSAESVAVQLLSNYSQRPLSRRYSLQPLMMSSPTSGDEPNHNGTKSLPIRRSGGSCYSLHPTPSPIVTNTSFQSLSSLHHQVSSTATRSTNIKLRGNSHWAPLRPQLICNIQRPTDKYSQWHSQNQRCAGCGFYIDSKCKEFHEILFCYYTGKFFCRLACHSGRKATLPAFVIQKWDFSCYRVSNFALKFLEKIREEPLFHINDLNPSLYKKVKQLNKLLDLRYQLKSLREYITICKNATDLTFYFTSFEPQHFIKDDIHLYSLDDLITIKRSKKLLEKCWTLVKESINHVSRCDHCKARGFLCELCNKKDILFPFEIGRIYQCGACRACYHLFCYNHQTIQKCSKCSRIKARRSKDCQPKNLIKRDISNESLPDASESLKSHHHDDPVSQPASNQIESPSSSLNSINNNIKNSSTNTVNS